MLVENKIFHTPVHSMPPSEYCHNVWYGI